ncbi:uncharacterized protein LOC141664646 [Apium graveolens]|uniref:uncharacterized protein LOC141664646 n=1 Tax=Apium graveolens TaxID=4045 RepID=UPI003D7C0FBF
MTTTTSMWGSSIRPGNKWRPFGLPGASVSEPRWTQLPCGEAPADQATNGGILAYQKPPYQSHDVHNFHVGRLQPTRIMSRIVKTRRSESGTAAIDRISSLPGNVVDHILERLPIHDAASTSVLSRSGVEAETNLGNNDPRDDDIYDAREMLQDFADAHGNFRNGEEEPTATTNFFYEMLDGSSEPLYPNCLSSTTLSFVNRLLYFKNKHGCSNKGFVELLELIGSILSEKHNLPETYYDVKKMISGLNMGYEKIDACENDCMVIVDGQLSHPADGDEWKAFDARFPRFAKEARNIRLGLSSDGFDPFCDPLARDYTVWPVVVVFYNLPPFMCMKAPYMFMPLIVPGPNDPTKDLYIYLRPKVTKRRPRDYGVTHNWTHYSPFFELPYWETLDLRHNIDVMHIEKNVFENIFYTILAVKNKTKDNLKSRYDCEELGIRRELWVQDGDIMPHAPYALLREQVDNLFEWISTLKLPDGYVSNISRCVNFEKHTIRGMKSHNCQIFMQKLLPIVCRDLLPRQVADAIIELSNFFQDLCSSTLKYSDLLKMEKDIVRIMSKFETSFTPGFFDPMEHLPLHLATECKVGGPVIYRLIYPFKRFLHGFKMKVRNKAHLEGSMAERYIEEECVHFCSLYF